MKVPFHSKHIPDQLTLDMETVTKFMASNGQFLPPDQFAEVLAAFQRLLANNEFLAAGENAHQMDLVAVAIGETLLANLNLPPEMIEELDRLAHDFRRSDRHNPPPTSCLSRPACLTDILSGSSEGARGEVPAY